MDSRALALLVLENADLIGVHQLLHSRLDQLDQARWF